MDANERDWEDFDAAATRPIEQHIRNSFIKTYKPVLDDAKYRLFESMDEKLVAALLDLDFRLTESEQREVRQGKGFIQLRNGPFDLDLIFAPDGIERFDDAWKRHVERHGFPIAHIDDLSRLLSFREWMKKGRGKASGFRKGANSSQARRFAKRRRISSLARVCG